MDIQALMNVMIEAGNRERSNYHVTLGEMIEIARKATGSVKYLDGKAPGDEDSYRGYYSDLSFEDADSKTASDFLSQLQEALGGTYGGYKGGEYTMNENTPLWRSEYGTTGEAIVSADIVDGDIVITTKNVD